MKQSWFDEVIDRWHPEIEWTTEDRRAVTSHLVAISRSQRGTVYEDVRISEKLARRHGVERAVGMLDALARYYASTVQADAAAPPRWQPAEGFDPALDFLRPVEFTPRLNINVASEEELEALPGIGRVTARRIVALRRSRGPITALSELKTVKGIGARQIGQLAPYVYVAPSVYQHPTWTSPGILELIRNPTFENYVRVLKDGEVSFSRYHQNRHTTLEGRILLEIRGLAEELGRSSHNPMAHVPGLRSSAVKERAEEDVRALEIEHGGIGGELYGVLVDDSKYGFFVLELLRRAERTVRVVMFFMRFEDRAKYPTDDLLNELAKARGRGVDVKVILDRDAEGEAIQSRVINEEAYRFLKRKRVAVTYDTVERYTHSKLVVVDQMHTVVGSHNWTAGSFFAYDDTSLYVQSPDLAAHYDRQFDELWEAYSLPPQ